MELEGNQPLNGREKEKAQEGKRKFLVSNLQALLRTCLINALRFGTVITVDIWGQNSPVP